MQIRVSPFDIFSLYPFHLSFNCFALLTHTDRHPMSDLEGGTLIHAGHFLGLLKVDKDLASLVTSKTFSFTVFIIVARARCCSSSSIRKRNLRRQRGNSFVVLIGNINRLTLTRFGYCLFCNHFTAYIITYDTF